MASCAQGALARMAVKEGTGTITWTSGATGLPPFRTTMGKKGKNVHPDVIIGSREEISERARKGPNRYSGWIVMALTPGHAALIYPWALGTDASGTTFALAETLQAFGILHDDVTSLHDFSDCYINRMIVQGEQHGPDGPPNFVTMAIHVIGKTYRNPAALTAATVTYPSLTLAVTGEYVPLILEDSTLTLAGSTRLFKKFKLDLNNYLHERYVNSLDVSTLCPRHRTVDLSVTLPYDTDNDDLYDQALAGATGTLALTNGTVSISHVFATLQLPAEQPEIPGKTEIDLELNMSARRLSSTGSLVATIDSTP